MNKEKVHVMAMFESLRAVVRRQMDGVWNNDAEDINSYRKGILDYADAVNEGLNTMEQEIYKFLEEKENGNADC